LVQPKERNIQYNHSLDIKEYQLAPGDQFTYFFETKDNDAINGSKSAKTAIMTFEKPTIEEFVDQEDENEDDITKTLEESLKES